MEVIKKLLAKYQFQYHRSYKEDGIEFLCYYDKTWGEHTGAKYMIELYENYMTISEFPAEYDVRYPVWHDIKTTTLKGKKFTPKNIEAVLLTLN